MTNQQRFQRSPASNGHQYAPSTIGAPVFTNAVDYEAFKQTPEDKGNAYKAKKDYKELMLKQHGSNWKIICKPRRQTIFTT